MPLLLLKLLPSAWSRWVIVCALFAAAVLAAWLSGVHHERARWEAIQALDEKVFLAGVVRAGKIGDRVVTKYVERERVVREQGETIYVQVPTYVTPQADRRCVVPAGFVRVHDAAAANVLPAAASAADEAPADLALSAVAETVTLNYTEFNAMREQCAALQAWAAEVSGEFSESGVRARAREERR